MMDERSAILSTDRLYRYELRRRWSDGPALIVIGLNPSTADEVEDDNTIRRCVGFAKREGCGQLVMLNLFAYRTKKPKVLWALPEVERVGPENDATLRRVLGEGGTVVAAWGVIPSQAADRVVQVRRILASAGVQPYCFDVTKDGHPGHPLYLKGDSPLLFWVVRGDNAWTGRTGKTP